MRKGIVMLKRGVYSLGICAICLFITSVPLFAEDQSVPQQVLDLQQAARLSTENKNFNLAQEKHQEIILNFPKTNYAMDAQSEIGSLYVKMGQIDKADAVLDTLSLTYRDNPKVVFAAQKVILACEEEKDYNTALMFCQKILGQYGTNQEAIRIQGWLAEAHIRLNQTAEADAIIQKMLEDGSEREYVFGSVIFNAGEAYLRDLNQPQKAIAVYRDFLNRYPGNPHNILTHRKLVDIYHKSDQTDKAAQEMSDFLTRYAGHEKLADIAAGGAFLLYDCKAYDKSIEFCKYSLTKLSGTEKGITLQIYLIRNYLRKGDFTSAEAELKTFFDRYSASPFCVDKGMILRGAFMQERRYETAANICEKLLKMYPSHEKAFDVLRALWINYQQADKVGDLGSVADTLLTQYEASEDKYLEVAAICSEIYLQGKDYFGALNISKTAFSKHPFSAKSAHLLSVQACAYLNLSDLSQAEAVIETLQTGYKYYAGFGKAMNDIAREYRLIGQYATAIDFYQQVLDMDADAAIKLGACEGLGKVYARQGDIQSVLQIVDTMTADYKDEQRYPGALFVLGEEYYIMAQEARKNGDQEAVRINYEKAIAVWGKPIYPDGSKQKIDALYFSATAYLYLRQYDAAIDAYSKVMDMQSGYGYAEPGNILGLIGRCYMGIAQEGIGDPNEAMANAETSWQTVVEQYPDNPMSFDAAMRLAELKERHRQWQDAARAYAFFLSHCGNDIRKVQTMFKLGNAYEQAGQKDLAFTAYSDYIRTAPVGDRYIAPAAKALLRLEGVK
jgi:tetratricopeptide (TPR) repeat protein